MCGAGQFQRAVQMGTPWAFVCGALRCSGTSSKHLECVDHCRPPDSGPGRGYLGYFSDVSNRGSRSIETCSGHPWACSYSYMVHATPKNGLGERRRSPCMQDVAAPVHARNTCFSQQYTRDLMCGWHVFPVFTWPCKPKTDLSQIAPRAKSCPQEGSEGQSTRCDLKNSISYPRSSHPSLQDHRTPRHCLSVYAARYAGREHG